MMTRSATSEKSPAHRDDEHRAEIAERRVEQLEQRLEALENSRQPRATNTESHFADASGRQLGPSDEALTALRNEPMMDHLLNALDSGQDIGHYGRLVFAMVAHHFLSEEDMRQWLTKDPSTNPDEIISLLRQVEGRDYNPPRRERIIAWQAQQKFPILPNPKIPTAATSIGTSSFRSLSTNTSRSIRKKRCRQKPQIPDKLMLRVERTTAQSPGCVAQYLKLFPVAPHPPGPVRVYPAVLPSGGFI